MFTNTMSGPSMPGKMRFLMPGQHWQKKVFTANILLQLTMQLTLTIADDNTDSIMDSDIRINDRTPFTRMRMVKGVCYYSAIILRSISDVQAVYKISSLHHHQHAEAVRLRMMNRLLRGTVQLLRSRCPDQRGQEVSGLS